MMHNDRIYRRLYCTYVRTYTHGLTYINVFRKSQSFLSNVMVGGIRSLLSTAEHCCSLSSAVVGGIRCLLSTAEHCCSLSSAVVGGIRCLLSTAEHCCSLSSAVVGGIRCPLSTASTAALSLQCCGRRD